MNILLVNARDCKNKEVFDDLGNYLKVNAIPNSKIEKGKLTLPLDLLMDFIFQHLYYRLADTPEVRIQVQQAFINYLYPRQGIAIITYGT